LPPFGLSLPHAAEGLARPGSRKFPSHIRHLAEVSSRAIWCSRCGPPVRRTSGPKRGSRMAHDRQMEEQIVDNEAILSERDDRPPNA
jgi:hypothetical protein